MATDPTLVLAVESCMLSSATPVVDVCDKASEIMRKISDRVPERALGKARACPHLLAIELACRSLSVLFSKDKLYGQTNVPTREFTQALTNCKSLLRLSFPTVQALDVLSVQFGASLRAPAVAVLRRYQEQYVGRLDQVRQNLIDLQAAEYQAAAYYLAAKQKKAAVDKRALLEATEVGSSLFHRILLDLERVCLEATAGGGGSSAESSLPATGARNAHKPAISKACASVF